MNQRPNDLYQASVPAERHGIFAKVLNTLRFLPGRANGSGGHRLVTAERFASDELGPDGNDARQLVSLREHQRELEDRLAARNAELAIVTNLLHESERSQAEYQDHTEWLTAISMVMIDKPAWWTILPPPVQRSAVHRRLRRKSLFDAQAYLENYPDVRKTKTDPLRHYVRHGILENRAMGFTPPPGGWAAPRSRQTR